MQQIWKHIKWMPVLMTATILGIAAFQLYWLKQAYDREARTLEIRSNVAFREAIHDLQASKLKIDRLAVDSALPAAIAFRRPKGGDKRRDFTVPDEKVISMVNVLRKRVNDSAKGNRTIVLREATARDSAHPSRLRVSNRKRVLEFLYDVETLQDTITVKEIQAAFTTRMEQQNVDVPFSISRLPVADDGEGERRFNRVTIGFRAPITYELQLGNTAPHLMKRILAPVLLSVFLLAFTIVSFMLLYRNLLKQRRLSDIKNEFISNITHELKTPIATVSVAIEALRSFNGSLDAQKTREYLDISANELQRLSLLVDKVLKLSMFENREVELKYEPLDMAELVDEVTASMRLQFEKHNAEVKVITDGNTSLEGDRLHLVSVIFNLMDNALKYKNGDPTIRVRISGASNKVSLSIEDKGIGIPPEYKEKVFEKFFRVPTGNLHNAKGYGLGLSYVAQVVQKHRGTIRVESMEGTGSTFIVSIPKHPQTA